MAQQWGGKLHELIRQRKWVSGIILCTLMILQLRGIAEGHGESLAVASLTYWVVGHSARQPGTHSSLPLSAHTQTPARLSKRPSPRYDLWKVLGRHYIFHKGILLHSCGLRGTVHCGLVPRQRRIKCRTWHWNRNLSVVSSGNLDLDLNSNKV